MAGKKILVADDSLTIQKVIRLALSGDGYEIQTVSDGKEAIEQASLFRPDICIIDVSLPHFDAYQIREQLLQKPDLKNIPVILMSSAFEKVDEGRAQKLGFAGHLIKPFDPSHLRSTLLSVSNHAPVNDPVEATINEPLHFEAPSSSAQPSAFQDHYQDFPPISPQEEVSGFHPGPSEYSVSHDDIPELARNTFELSGHNNQEWGMIEPGKMDAPFEEEQTYTPAPAQNEISHFDLHEIEIPLHSPGYQEGSTSHQVSISPDELQNLVKTEVSKIMEQMQAEMQRRLEDDLKRYSQQLMPTLAERIIKEEIHKLLTHPPV